MEAPLQVQCGPPLEPLECILGLSAKPLACPSHSAEHQLRSEDTDYLHGSHFSPNGTSAPDSVGSSTTLDDEEEEEESLVDSQPICFKENPFLVANRKGKGRPPAEQILSGPPVGYGRRGQLQPWLFSKARRLPRVCFGGRMVCPRAQFVWLRSLGSPEKCSTQTFSSAPVLTP